MICCTGVVSSLGAEINEASCGRVAAVGAVSTECIPRLVRSQGLAMADASHADAKNAEV